jgi:hypothetical protein
MLQVATFKISKSLFSPSQQEEANEFLKAHKPVGNINFNRDTIVVFYEDDPAADIVELLESVGNARFQQEIALHMLKRDIAGLKPTNKKYDELADAIRQTEDAIGDQDAKAEYLKVLIAEKRSAS